MLTILLELLPISWRHRLFRAAHVDRHVHDWCPGFCPCGGWDE